MQYLRDLACDLTTSQDFHISVATTINTQAASTLQEQNVQFHDAESSYQTVVDSMPDPTFSIADFGDANLGEFLARPVNIATFDWRVGSELNQVIAPWQALFANSALKKRLDNFTNLRCKLHVKFLINGTPFHYGRIMVSYIPWPEYNSTNVPILSNQNNLVMYSQRPHIFLDPCTNEGGEFVLPFLHLENWIKVPSSNAFAEMGDLYLTSFADLAHAGEGSSNVTITAYAWATEVSMCVPTTSSALLSSSFQAQSDEAPAPKKPKRENLVDVQTHAGITIKAPIVPKLTEKILRHFKKNTASKFQAQSNYKVKGGKKRNTKQKKSSSAKQSRGKPRYNMKMSNNTNEYAGDGIVSGTATAIAKVAGSLEAVPFLQPFAMATRVGASAVSGIAKIFGFSRPMVVDNPHLYKMQVFGNMAATDMPENVAKLTVDSKQEITIDPRTVGLGDTDELVLDYLTQKETFLTQFPWQVTQTPHDFLWGCNVTPMLEHIENTDTVYPTALSFASVPFKHWSGTLKYRFQVVCSGFHHGRLLIQYDPVTTNVGGPLVNTNVAYSRIVDIGDERDFTLDIGWAQPQPYKRTDWNRLQGARYTSDHIIVLQRQEEFDNGILTVKVLNELTAPTDTADIYINVYVSAGEDFELRNPISKSFEQLTYLPVVPEQSTFQAQSDEQAVDSSPQENNPEPGPSEDFVGQPEISMGELKSQVFFGEAIESFRTLLRRYNFLQYVPFQKLDEAEACYQYLQYATPPSRGFGGPFTTISGNNFNYCKMTLFNYLAPAYLGYRGSLRYKHVAHGTHTGWVERAFDLPGPQYQTTEIVHSDASIAAASYSAMKTNANAGTQVYDLTTMPGMEIEYPFQQGKRFAFSSFINANGIGSTRDETSRITNRVSLLGDSWDDTTPVGISQYVSVGEDFNLFYFINAPPVHFVADPAPKLP